MSLEKKKLKEYIKKILCREDLEVRRDVFGTYTFSLAEKKDVKITLFKTRHDFRVFLKNETHTEIDYFLYFKHFRPLIKKHEKYLAIKAKEEKERLETVEVAELQKLIDELE